MNTGGIVTRRLENGQGRHTGLEMIVALTKLNAPALLERFLREVITSSYDGSEKSALLAAVSALGDTQAAAVLSGLMSARMPERPNECSELLLALSENPSLCFPEAAEAAVAAIDFIGAHDKGTETLDWEPEEPQRLLDPQFLENLLRALQRFKGGTLCGAAAEKIASHPEIYCPVTLVVPAIERICAGRRQQTAAVDTQCSASMDECGGIPAPAQRNSTEAASRTGV